MAVNAVGSGGPLFSGGGGVRDAFLKLLVSELRNQNPLEPVSNTDFMAQLAQFGTLEQIGTLNSNRLGCAAAQQLLGDGALIGKTVEYVSSDGTEESGVVKSVGLENGEIVLEVGDENVLLGNITKIAEGPPPSDAK